jgi:hypothetical protein
MTARVSTNLNFLAGAYFGGSFFMNSYDIDLTMNIGTESVEEQNIALERIKHLVHEVLTDSIFVNQAETQVIEKYVNADLKVCTLPEDPYDQVIGIMLMLKINSIAEGRLLLTDISICSELSDNVSCMIEVEDNIGPFMSAGWWNECSCKINDVKIKNSSKKVVKLVKHKTDWSDIYLAWDNSKAKIQTPNSEVLFASFDNKTET